MKRFLAGIMTAAIAATMVAGIAVSSSAAPEGETDIRGIIPRTKVDATLDAKDDEEFWAGAYYEELNEETAFIKDTQMEDEPTTDLPSLKIKLAYYSEIADGTSPDDMLFFSQDPKGGILIYAEVIDKHKAFAFGETKYEDGQEAFYGVHTANATDCVQLAFDPLNSNGTSGGAGGSVIFSLVPYSIVAPEGANSAPGVGTVAGGRGWWWQHWGGNGYGDSASDLNKDAVEIATNTDYVFAEKYQLPGDNVTNLTRRRLAIRNAYQHASIEGYQIEAKIHWNNFEIDKTFGIKPYEGRQFGMLIALMDYMFDDFNINLGTNTPEAYQHVYRVYLNGGDEDEGWMSVDNPSSWPTYQFGGYIGENPNPDIIYGDANGDGSVDITDAMMIFYHVAKKEMMTDADQLKRCDVDKNGDVDITDAMRVFYYVAKKVDRVEMDDSVN